MQKDITFQPKSKNELQNLSDTEFNKYVPEALEYWIQYWKGENKLGWVYVKTGIKIIAEKCVKTLGGKL